jgi:Fic family protein
MKYSKKLHQILDNTGWTQEALSYKLGVSFVTLNSWINEKSEPRAKAKVAIDELYDTLVGKLSVSLDELNRIKKVALSKKCSLNSLLKNKDTLDKLTVGFTFHSNGTEGSTMTEDDVLGVLFDNEVLSNRSAIEQREAVNHRAALYFLIDELNNQGKKFTITTELIKNIHLRLMNGIITNAGQFRNHSVRVKGSSAPRANHLSIEKRLKDFLVLVNEKMSDPISTLAKSHISFEQIHPFSDGNGRIGRLLIFAIALYSNKVPPIIRKDRKNAYYRYLELGHTKNQSDLLEELLAEEMVWTSTEFFGF